MTPLPGQLPLPYGEVLTVHVDALYTYIARADVLYDDDASSALRSLAAESGHRVDEDEIVARVLDIRRALSAAEGARVAELRAADA